MNVITLSSWIGVFIALGSAATFLFYIFIVLRTNSLHVVRRRLWLIVNGNQEISAPAIRSFVDDQTSLIAFRMFSGLRAENLEQAHLLMEWARVNNISFQTLAGCGSYFDVELRMVRENDLPKRFMYFAQIFLFCVFHVMVAFCIMGMASSKIALSFSTIDKSFLADASSANAIWPVQDWFANQMKQAECKEQLSTPANQAFFKHENSQEICALLNSEKWRANYPAELSKQRMALFGIAILPFIFAVFCMLSINKIRTARKLARRRINPFIDGSQLSLDFSSNLLDLVKKMDTGYF